MPDVSTYQLVLAALGGGLGANVLTAVTKRAEFSREDRARWLDQRRAAYAGFLAAQRTLEFRGMQLALMKALGPLPQQLAQTREAEIRQARADAQRHRDELELIAPMGVLQAARELDQAVGRLVESVEISQLENGTVQASALAPHRAAVDDWAVEFLRLARRDLRAPRGFPWRPRSPGGRQLDGG